MVAMAIMVSSFRESLDEWVQRILPADVYVRVGASTQSAYLDPAAQRALAGLEGVRRADFLRYVDVVMPDGQPLNVIARAIDAGSADELLMMRKVAQRTAAAADRAGLDLGGGARSARARCRYGVRAAAGGSQRACERARRSGATTSNGRAEAWCSTAGATSR